MRDPIKLILTRHAQRGADGETGDESLSPSGREQAERLSKALKAILPDLRPSIISSPKIRCRETAEIIASGFEVSIKVSPLLEECRPSESPSHLSQRVGLWLAELESVIQARSVVAVSHVDWLEEATSVMLDNRLFLRWAPATAHLFEYAHGKMVHSGLITV